jgi:glycosyltransferase involved in cell wall biosynthesis
MMRIGIAFPGNPGRRETWSGIPFGLIGGLEDAGVEPVAVAIEPPAPLRRACSAAIAASYLQPQWDLLGAAREASAAARASAGMATLTTMAVPAALRRAGRLDGVIQIGTGYTVRSEAPVVTYEDMTIRQTRTHPYPGWELLSRRSFDSRVMRQRRAYESAVACCLTSPWAAASVRDEYGIAAEKVHAVGIGRNHAAPAVERSWEQPRFLFVGLDWQRKNGPGLLRAFARLREQRPEAQLDVVGGHPPLNQPGVTGHGILRLNSDAERRQLEQLYAAATCFAMPSHSEASAIAYVEAAAAGLPSIGTDQGGSDFLIGEGGLIVDPSDDDDLLEAMLALCEPETAAQMGTAAQKRSRLFTWSAVASRLVRALEGEPAGVESEACVA